jgi:hypothetical protein
MSHRVVLHSAGTVLFASAGLAGYDRPLMTMTRFDERGLAIVGAQVRLEALRAEEARLVAAFPELANGRNGSAGGLGKRREEASPAKTTRRTRTMTAAQRRAVGERMTKYWAARRKAKASPAKAGAKRKAAKRAVKTAKSSATPNAPSE